MAPSPEESACVHVEVLQIGLVQPASTPSPSHNSWLPLSPSDVLMREVNYTRRVLFYRRPLIDMEYSVLLRRLQASLAQALVHFYPLAGHLAVHEGRLAVRCNDAGAEFVQAAMHGAPPSLLSHLERCQFAMQPFFSDLARWASYPSLHEGSAPLLSIQVTRFPCGGIALGVASSHVIADGTSFWHFMRSWVECARGKTLSLLPLHKRTLLTPIDADLPHGRKATSDFFETLHDHGDSKDEKKIEKAFSFSQEMVQKLKEVTKHKYSSYEVTCAHIWKRTINARSYPSDTKVGFINVVNMRERLDPPLPKGYFGNAILWSIATATVGELTDEDLSNTAARIHAAILACSTSRMQEFLQVIDVDSCSLQYKILQPLKCNGVRMRVSSSAKFPVFHIDFGWGIPIAARSATVEETNKLALYPGTHSPGSIAACLALPTHVMEKLENDPSFLDEEYSMRE